MKDQVPCTTPLRKKKQEKVNKKSKDRNLNTQESRIPNKSPMKKGILDINTSFDFDKMSPNKVKSSSVKKTIVKHRSPLSMDTNIFKNKLG
jgi:hypothetical protein